MKKIIFSVAIGFLIASCSSNDELYMSDEQINKSESTMMQKGDSPFATEWVDLEFTETTCQTSRKRYQGRAVSSQVYNRDRYVSFKIIDNTSGTEWYNGEYKIPAGTNVSTFDKVFPNEILNSNITYEVTNVEINPFYYDSNGNLVYQPVIGLYEYKSGNKDINNCQLAIIN